MAAVVAGGVAAMPSSAEAQDCVARQFDWASQPPPGYKRTLDVQVIHVHDTLGWTGYGNDRLEFVAGSFVGGVRRPSKLMSLRNQNPPPQLTYSDRGFCRDTDSGGLGCWLFQRFNVMDPDQIQITFTNNLFNLGSIGLGLSNLRWGYNHNVATGVCLNNNTIAYSVPGDVTYVFTFKQVETFIPR